MLGLRGGRGQGKSSHVLYTYYVPDVTLLFYPRSPLNHSTHSVDEETETQKRERPCPGPQSKQRGWAPVKPALLDRAAHCDSTWAASL